MNKIEYQSVLYILPPQVLLVTGGYGYGEHLNRLDTTELLRPGSGWQEISSARLPRPLRGMRVTTVENRVLLFGELNISYHLYPPTHMPLLQVERLMMAIIQRISLS